MVTIEGQPLSDVLAATVGRNLQQLRGAAKLSLSQLAQLSGVSRTALHKLEQGDANPTLATLWALATALGVTLGELIEEPAADVAVVPASTGARVDGEAVHARLVQRLRGPATIEIYDLEVDVHEQRSDGHASGVEEILIVTHGSISAGPEDAPARLGPGDAVRFVASTPHLYRGHETANRALLLMVHPTR